MEFQEILLPATRCLERLIITLTGTLSIFLGYKLFTIVSDSLSDLQSEVGNFKLTIRRAGPGIFFALFGSAILIIALNNVYSTTPQDKNDTEQGRQGSVDGRNPPGKQQPGSTSYAFTPPPDNIVTSNIGFIQSINTLLKLKYSVKLNSKNDEISFDTAISKIESLRNRLIVDTYSQECMDNYAKVKLTKSKNPSYAPSEGSNELKCYNDIDPLVTRSIE
jgi:hypothetical protein